MNPLVFANPVPTPIAGMTRFENRNLDIAGNKRLVWRCQFASNRVDRNISGGGGIHRGRKDRGTPDNPAKRFVRLGQNLRPMKGRWIITSDDVCLDILSLINLIPDPV